MLGKDVVEQLILKVCCQGLGALRCWHRHHTLFYLSASFPWPVQCNISGGHSVTEGNINSLISVQCVFDESCTLRFQSSKRIANYLKHPSPLTFGLITLPGTNR